MRPGKEPKRRSRPSSPLRDRTRVPSGFEPRSPGFRSSVSVLDREELLAKDIAVLEGRSISSDSSNSNLNPRSFPYAVKHQCSDKAEKIKGQDPDRWRRDPLGNIVFRKLVGCSGVLKLGGLGSVVIFHRAVNGNKGGQSTVENCQALQAHGSLIESPYVSIPANSSLGAINNNFMKSSGDCFFILSVARLLSYVFNFGVLLGYQSTCLVCIIFS
ncbi:hypothetical protein FNV43_RR20432 [Rhamnella rubrinervis]|uniref:Uncharacterized protein n=1 Tax=Rhamnella rubrinervis TaxID=2594499 RepID=A0A8K0DVX1_9ROSA|nr:hypothetical protein FNV43_RR20432 [Rhamnella rubrinervis]